MKISFTPQGIPYEDKDGNYEVDSVLLHRYSLADDEVVDKYPGKTDRQVQVIEHDVAIAAAEAAIEAWDADESNEGKPGRPTVPPALREE
jgi:hypothetical protein